MPEVEPRQGKQISAQHQEDEPGGILKPPQVLDPSVVPFQPPFLGYPSSGWRRNPSTSDVSLKPATCGCSVSGSGGQVFQDLPAGGDGFLRFFQPCACGRS